MAGNTDSIDRFRAAAALGLELSRNELSRWQASAGPSECVGALRMNLVEAAGHDDLLADIVRYLLNHKNRFVRVSAACHPSTGEADRREVLASPDVVELLNGPQLDIDYAPEHIIAALRSSSDPAHRCAVVRSSKSPENLSLLLADTSFRVTRLLAENRYLPPHGFAVLARSKDISTRTALARHRALPNDVARVLASDDEELVREVLAANCHVDGAVLIGLVNDAQSVRMRLSRQSPLTDELAALLAEDTDRDVREALAKNSTCPSLTLDRLLGRVGDEALLGNNNSPANVIETIVSRSVLFSDALDVRFDGHVDVLCKIARHSSAPEAALTKIADLVANEQVGSVAKVRDGLFSNPSLPDHVLLQLSRHSEEVVRVGVAKHVATPQKVLRRLAVDEIEEVRRGVASNSAAPKAVANSLRHDFPKEVSSAYRARRRQQERTNNRAQRKWSAHRGNRLLRKHGLDDVLANPQKYIKNSDRGSAPRETTRWGFDGEATT